MESDRAGRRDPKPRGTTTEITEAKEGREFDFLRVLRGEIRFRESPHGSRSADSDPEPRARSRFGIPGSLGVLGEWPRVAARWLVLVGMLWSGSVACHGQAPATNVATATGSAGGSTNAAAMPRVDEASAAIIKGAIRFLASKQLPNGAWGMTDFERRHPVAMTAYTLMAFLAAGHLPGEGEEGKAARAGLQYLLESAKPDGTFGDRNLGQYMYNHGVATIALAELYGQTQAADIKPKLDRAIRLIIASQNSEGGWRYRPVAQDADISVTVLQVVGLRAAKNSGIEVPAETIERAVRYVKSCYDPGSGGFTYQPGNRAPGYARTAAAIYSLQVCGVYDDPLVKRGSEYLLKNFGQREWFTYGTFYAVPAQYMMGGEAWSSWYPRMRTQLVRQVVREGDKAYWDGSIDMGSNGLGPVYATAVYVSVLAMPWNYVPIYQR